MLPCSVIFEEYDNGEVEESAVDPMTTMQVVENKELKKNMCQVPIGYDNGV